VPGSTDFGTTPQVSQIPFGAVSAGDGSTAGANQSGLMLGGGLLLAAAMAALFGWRSARRN